ncbi:MAG: helix-turn-helix transcriptional regulator [Myxococcales bacterium]|nr:helix-turn-helix transcriptional regulator [Myxococcales bacterium]
MRTKPRGVRLAALRLERGQTQSQVAKGAGFKQEAVSRLERVADDAKVSTLRRYVESLGGELRVVAVFRGGEERVVQFAKERAHVDD